MKNFFVNIYKKLLDDKFIIYTLISIVLKLIIFEGFTLDKNAADFYLVISFFYTLPKLHYYITFTGLFLSFAFLSKGNIRIWGLYVFNTLISLLLLTDIWYYRGFSTMTSLHLLSQTSNLDNLSDSILSLIKFNDLIFIFDLPILLIVMLWKKSLLINKTASFRKFIVSILLCSFIILIVPFKTYILGIPDRFATFSMLDANITTYNLSPIGYHVMNAYNYLSEDTYKSLNEKDLEKIKKWYKDNNNSSNGNPYYGLMKGKNLILLQLESFESFPINKTIEGQEITPNLNKLLKNSIYFPNVLEQVNLGTTSDAEFMLNTSIYPLRDGSVFFRYPYNRYPSFPKLLEEKGYSTISAHPDKGSYWNWMIAHKNIGFQHSIDSTAFEHDENIGMGLSDGSFLRQLAEKLKLEKQPFYNFSITLSNHAPFDLPLQYRELKLSSELDKTVVGGYLQSVKYVDTQIGKLLGYLKESNLSDNTVLALCGDHEGIHKYYQADIDTMNNLPEWLKENDKRLPFIIYNPALEQAEINTLGGQVDVMPTLLYLMGVEENKFSKTVMGKNLFTSEKSFAVLKNGKVIGELSDSDSSHAIEGLQIADILIKSNYFEKYNKDN